ncbi:hypothetical protein HDU78_003457 [Chytriomyces hyalinus]|nr:hypothetical protein HDU78_003457 [Chytriomyces hyalinus]
MGLLTVGTPLPWDDARKHADHVRAHGIRQFLNIWNNLKHRRRDKLLWGDEIEYVVVAFEGGNGTEKTVKATANAYEILLKLEERERLAVQAGEPISWSFKPEYGRYMLEGTPAGPYGSTLDHLLDVEPNMVARRKLAATYLGKNEALVSITNFPLLGVNVPTSFLEPSATPTPLDGASKSLFIPDAAINPHPRFRTLTANIRERRESKVSINVPIFKDVNTPSPFLEPAPTCMDGFCEDRKSAVRRESQSSRTPPSTTLQPATRQQTPTLPDLVPDAKPDHIYMDAMCFGMGCCCLQVTFQACSVEEARKLYDHLAPLTPIMMALSAGAPIFRGYLADVDCRWNVISASVDDRTKEERGIEPLEKSRFKIPKSRYASISTYLSPGPNYSGGCMSDPDVASPSVSSLPPAVQSHFDEKYNDIDLVYDKDIHKELVENGIDDMLARHYAHLYIRDPLVVFSEKLDLNDETSSDHFENIQSTNWQTMRFKPPPPLSPIGWRVEFRSMEVQLSDFENAAYSVFIVLLTRTILSFDLNFYMALSKVDENMEIGQKRDAVLNERFKFRKNIFGNDARRPAGFEEAPAGVHMNDSGYASSDAEDYMGDFSVDVIINGKTGVFPGLIPLIRAYLALHPSLPLQTLKILDSYLDLLSRRASGKIPTAARWMRNFVAAHPDYKGDSVVGQSVAWDLMKRVDEIGKTEGRIPGLSL